MSNGDKKRSPSPNSVSKLFSNPFKNLPATSPILETSISPQTGELTVEQDKIPDLSPEPVLEPVTESDVPPIERGDALPVETTQKSRWNSLLFWNGNEQLDDENEQLDDENAQLPIQEEGESQIWFGKLSGLFIRNIPEGESLATTGVLNDQFLPNTISSIKTASQIVNVTTNGVEDQTKKNQLGNEIEEQDEQLQPSSYSSWFTPWRWGDTNVKTDIGDASDSMTLTMDDDESKLFRKLVVNSIQCLSYGIEKPSSWGIFKKFNDDVGEVRLTGNKSCKRGVLMKRLPKSNFEIQEELLSNQQQQQQHQQRKVGGGGLNNGSGVINDTFLENGNDSTITIGNEAVVLPDLKWNYRPLTMITKSRIISSKILPCIKPERHLYTLPKNLRKRTVKKVIVISIHGFLPQKFTKSMSNESSGTSKIMSEFTNRELDRWGILNNVELQIDNIQLESYGKIFERVNDSMSIIENWGVDIGEADYLFMVCNSNSVTIGIHLMSKMISSGILQNIEKLGILGISGMTLGPIPDLEGKILTRGGSIQENEMISEIFDFEDPESLQSRELIRSFETIIRNNCKISFAAGLQDCISPLYSSLSLQFGHANIFRMIYIDSEINLPDFLVTLFNTILGLKNLNYSDHGLLVELSNFFQGKQQSGGHSVIIMNKHIYRMGISNLLDTNDLKTLQKLQVWPKNIRDINVNPYHIPWCLRGILEELTNVRGNWEVEDLMHQLMEEFSLWDSTNEWGELRKCMEAFGGVRGIDIGL